MTLSKARIKQIASLRQKKYRDRLGEYVIEGARSIRSALDAGVELRDVVMTGAAARAQPFEGYAVDAVEVDERTFERLSNVETSQGVLAVAPIQTLDEERVLQSRRILALDAVQDPGNAGTLIRTAAWFGIDAVVAGPGTVDFFNPKTVRSSMGGLFDVMLGQVDDLAAFLRAARGRGFSTFGADMEGVDAPDWAPGHPSILVVGNEGAGLSAAVAAELDGRVTIPATTAGRAVESLNVAQAATILMYLWTR